MDRASGSGVFARDPDALVDLVELELTEELVKARSEKAVANVYQRALQEKAIAYYQQHVSLDDLESRSQMQQHFDKAIKDVMIKQPYLEAVKKTQHEVEIATAWRIEGTLREFAKFSPVNMWFSYPRHELDIAGVLADIKLEESKPNWQKVAKNAREGKKTKVQKSEERKEKLEEAFEAQKSFSLNGPVTKGLIAEYLGVKERTVENYINEHDDFILKNGTVFRLKN